MSVSEISIQNDKNIYQKVIKNCIAFYKKAFIEMAFLSNLYQRKHYALVFTHAVYFICFTEKKIALIEIL